MVKKLKADTFAFRGFVTTLNPQGLGTVRFDPSKAKRAPYGNFDLALLDIDDVTRAKVQIGERVMGTARRGNHNHRIIALKIEE